MFSYTHINIFYILYIHTDEPVAAQEPYGTIFLTGNYIILNNIICI